MTSGLPSVCCACGRQLEKTDAAIDQLCSFPYPGAEAGCFGAFSTWAYLCTEFRPVEFPKTPDDEAAQRAWVDRWLEQGKPQAPTRNLHINGRVFEVSDAARSSVS